MVTAGLRNSGFGRTASAQRLSVVFGHLDLVQITMPMAIAVNNVTIDI